MDSSRDQTCLQRQNVFSAEFRDLQATAMSVDWTGQWILLAGRRHLALQRIDFAEDNSLRKYHRNSKYDVSAAEWAICENSQEYCAIATSQLIEVVTWSSGDPTLIYSLRAHTRLVTDIDWHSKEPHLLASCSIDTFTHLWDLRDPRKPTLSLSAVCMSGATQVGFNRVSGNLLATAHDGDLRIWDIRKGSCPIQYITAHLARIHGINWSHSRESCLATASQDGTIKYFDISNPRRSGNLITTSSPVWRARYTPIGNGLVSIIVPHLGRGENSLLLWSNVKQSDPICSFVGHTDVILDFAWRPNRENAQEIEFVTWSRDQTLRVWKIDESLLKLCNPPQPEYEDEGDHWNSSKLCNSNDLTLKTAIENAPCSLQQEFAVFNTNIPHIEVQILDAGKRYATFKVTVSNYIIVLQINFPLEYPSSNVCPEFRFCQGTTIDESLSLTLMKALKTHALQKSKKGKTFLEQSLRFLVSSFKRSTSGGDKSQLRLQSPRLEGALSGALHDACIPFPKTSGAKFNNIGILVTFFQPIHTKRISIRHQNTTPRALSALSGGYLGNVLGSQPVLYAHRDSNTSNFYIQDRLRKTTRSRNLRRTYASAVVNVYDASKALNLNKNLAINYIINKMDIPGTCKHNMEIAMSAGRSELIQAWHLAEVVATSNTAKSYDSEMLFHQNPFKRSLLESLIMHFAKYGDVQTSVTLCCTFDTNYSDLDLAVNHKPANKSPICSPYYTIVPGETNHAWSLSTQLRQIRSNSWSECYDGLEWKLPFSDISRPFFSKTKKNLFDHLKKVFGEILYGWDLITVRAMILKQLSYPTEMPQCVEFVTECLLCNRVSRSTSCNFCRKALLYCTLCRLPVKGLANACLLCGHGGHTEHLDQWFKNHEICASGCGCFCLKETANVLKEIN